MKSKYFFYIFEVFSIFFDCFKQTVNEFEAIVKNNKIKNKYQLKNC